LDAAGTLDDLRVPPGNRLEKLKGDRAGSYSVRINQQWRICFSWMDAGPEGVEIVDYHWNTTGKEPVMSTDSIMPPHTSR
jgi:proteic killer suppression protein